MTRALAAVVTLGLLAGCGGGGGSTATSTGAKTQTTQTTRVEVIKGASAGASGFSPQAIYKSEAPGVVTVVALSDGGEALGSGFVIDGNGYIATNAHVVTGQSGGTAKQVYVKFGDGNQLAAQIVGTDLDADVALLKVDPAELRGPNAKLVSLPFGSTTQIKVGDPVVAIGSPFGEPQSLSVGVVSALNRDIESLTNFPIGNAIQTDAAINHGNSGGPLLQRDGKVIGINSQIRSSSGGGEGVGFAIPVETVKRSVDQLRAHGHVDYAYLGVSSVPLYPQLAEHLGLKTETGALVDQVVPGGPADAAGVQGAKSHTTFQGTPRIPVGSDLIVAVDGHKLTSTDDLTDLIGLHQPGDTVQLTVIRNGIQKAISVKLGKRPERIAGAR